MGQDINEMMQETPVLTLDPFGETKEEVVEVKEEQVEELDVLTPEEKKMVADFAAKIDLRSSNAILQYGAGAQKKIADFLTANKIYYEKQETYIESEKMILVIFEI